MMIGNKLAFLYFKIGIILFLLLIYCSFFTEAYANSVIKNIIKTYHLIQALNKKAINSITFELVREQPYLAGAPTKFVLRGSDGELWLFKAPSDRRGIETPVAVSSWAQLLGINVPESYLITLPVNGRATLGHIQKFYPSLKSFLGGFKMQFLSAKQIEQIQKHQVLDWFVYNPDPITGSFFFDEAGEIVAIDKDKSLIRLEYSSLDPEEIPPNYDSFWSAYIEGRIGVDFAKPFELIDHIQAFDSDIVIEIFSKFGSKVLDALLLRKKNLRRVFEGFYQTLADKRGEEFQRLPEKTNGNFSKTILNNLRDKLRQKKAWLKRIVSNKGEEQKNIGVIYLRAGLPTPDHYCPGRLAPGLIETGLEFFIKDISQYNTDRAFDESEEVNRCKLVSTLKRSRDEAKDIHEKLAISLYIAQIRRFYENSSIRHITQHPKDVSLDEIVNYLGFYKKTLQCDQIVDDKDVLDEEDQYLLELARKLRDMYK
jgi:hypothetical protein